MLADSSTQMSKVPQSISNITQGLNCTPPNPKSSPNTTEGFPTAFSSSLDLCLLFPFLKIPPSILLSYFPKHSSWQNCVPQDPVSYAKYSLVANIICNLFLPQAVPQYWSQDCAPIKFLPPWNKGQTQREKMILNEIQRKPCLRKNFSVWKSIRRMLNRKVIFTYMDWQSLPPWYIFSEVWLFGRKSSSRRFRQAA